MLKIVGLSVNYQQTRALNNVSLVAEEGQVTTILGRNGAGKTTLLKTISGLVKAANGQFFIGDTLLTGLGTSDIVRNRVSQVPEGRELFPRMSVAENLMMGAHLRRDTKVIQSDLESLYEDFPVLGHKRKTLVRNLSGGEQQMVAIARALMAAPKVLLLDEPSIGLAPLVEQSLMQTLKSLAHERGLAVVLVEQNAHLALSIADKGYVLDLGEVVLDGTADALLNNSDVKRIYLGL